MKKINLQDSVRLINAEVDGYGDPIVLEEAVVAGAFFEGMSVNDRNNTDMVEAYDAHCYVDETSAFVLDNAYRLEGMYLVVNLYGDLDSESWYKIRDVKLGVTKMLDNQVNNCHCFLQKVEAIEKTPEPESN